MKVTERAAARSGLCFIVPLFPALDRVDERLLAAVRAARDLGASRLPIKPHSAVRTAPTPALNALATLLLAASALALVLAWPVLRRRGSTAALRDMASM